MVLCPLRFLLFGSENAYAFSEPVFGYGSVEKV